MRMKRLELIHIKCLTQCLAHSKYLISNDDAERVVKRKVCLHS